jgi:hypothetical protein
MVLGVHYQRELEIQQKAWAVIELIKDEYLVR